MTVMDIGTALVRLRARLQAARTDGRALRKTAVDEVTIELLAAQREERAIKARAAQLLAEIDEAERTAKRRLPLTRAECVDAVRPCPHVTCRHHLVTEYGDDADPNGPTCSLDEAERGGMTLEEIGDMLGVTRERIRQIEDRAIKRLLPVMRKNGLTRDDAWGFAHARNVHEEEAIDAGQDCDSDQSRRWRVAAKRKAGK